MDDAEKRAQTRFGIISLVRLGGAILAAIGLLSVAGAIEWVPQAIAYMCVIAGLFGTLIAPRLLARRWRSDDMGPPA